MKIFNFKNKQKGLTLIELLVSIGIAAVIVTVALTLFSTTSEKNKVGVEVKNVGTLSASITNLFATATDYTGLNNSVMLASNGIPASMRGSAAGTIDHVWEPASITIAASNAAGAAGVTHYRIQYSNVPRQSCVELVSALVNSFSRVNIGAAQVTNIAQITAGCGTGAGNAPAINFIGY